MPHLRLERRQFRDVFRLVVVGFLVDGFNGRHLFAGLHDFDAIDEDDKTAVDAEFFFESSKNDFDPDLSQAVHINGFAMKEIEESVKTIQRLCQGRLQMCGPGQSSKTRAVLPAELCLQRQEHQPVHPACVRSRH